MVSTGVLRGRGDQLEKHGLVPRLFDDLQRALVGDNPPRLLCHSNHFNTMPTVPELGKNFILRASLLEVQHTHTT